jgi:hypothetical protein
MTYYDIGSAYDAFMEQMLESSITKTGLRLHYRLSSVMEFYKQCFLIEKSGNPDRHQEYRRSCFKHGIRWHNVKVTKEGFDAFEEEINRRKLSFKEHVVEIEKDSRKMVQAAGKRVYKWDELDGDDMNMERLYEHSPAMRKRIFDKGQKHGRIMSIFVGIAENGFVSAEQLSEKTKTVIKIVKYLESLGTRCEVILYDKSYNSGKMGKEPIASCLTEITIKRASDPLNIGLLSTTISPWMFRYWCFLFYDAKFNSQGSYGSAARLKKQDLKFRKGQKYILIDKGDCLNKKTSEEFIKQVMNNEKTSII